MYDCIAATSGHCFSNLIEFLYLYFPILDDNLLVYFYIHPLYYSCAPILHLFNTNSYKKKVF